MCVCVCVCEWRANQERAEPLPTPPPRPQLTQQMNFFAFPTIKPWCISFRPLKQIR